MTFKEFILGLIKKVSNILLIISTIGLIASIVLMAINQAIDSGMMIELADNPFFEWLTLDAIGTASVYLGAVVTAGGIAKVAGSGLKKVINNSKDELEKQAQVYEAKIDKIKNDSIDAMILMGKSINELVNAQKEASMTNKQILEVMLVTAKRNIGSNLVSDEDKKLYKTFIKNVEGRKDPKLENIYMTIIEKIDKDEEIQEESKDFLTKIIEDSKHED